MLGYQVNITVIALGTFIAPRIAELFHQGRTAELQELLKNVSRTNLTFGAVIVVGLVLRGQLVVPLVLGKAYADAYLPTCIYAFGQLLSLTLGPVATLANMSGFEQITTLTASLGLLLALAFALALCPAYGAPGAAVATPLAVFISKGVLSIAVARKTSISPWAFL